MSRRSTNILDIDTLDPAKMFQVSPYFILPSRSGDFALYLRQGDNFVLYSNRGEMFNDRHRQRLVEMEVEELYIRADEKKGYQNYIRENLGELLYDESIPIKDRSRAWFDCTQNIARSAFDRNLPRPVDRVRFNKITGLIRSTAKFFARPEALREMGRFVSQGFDHFEHGVSVMVLTAAVLSTYDDIDNEIMVGACVGALMHDIGKLELPENIFEMHPDDLNEQGRNMVRSHPAMGVGICSSLPLPQETLQCILFHHELADGTGYPSGASSQMLPHYAQVVALCNEYENLTRGAVWRKPRTPFEALTRIKSRGKAYDLALLKRLISVLSKAKIT